MPYSEHEIERIGRIGFETAMKRRKKLTCVDKANVLDTSRLWRAVMHRLAGRVPRGRVQRTMFVDNCAMQICKDPAPVRRDRDGKHVRRHSLRRGQRRSPAPSAWCRPPPWARAPAACMSPSTALRPTLPGRTWSNPIAMHSLGGHDAALQPSICPPRPTRSRPRSTPSLDEGYRTADMMAAGCTRVGCTEMGDKILENI